MNTVKICKWTAAVGTLLILGIIGFFCYIGYLISHSDDPTPEQRQMYDRKN